MDFAINNRIICRDSMDFYLIAEIGVNYYEVALKENISLIDAAKTMIREAKRAGCDAVKFQIYKAETLASKYSNAYWDTNKETTESQYNLFKKYDKLDYNSYFELQQEAKNNSIDFLATLFDDESITLFKDFLPAFKIASADITNKPLIKQLAVCNKPIILSTGASKISEIWEALEWIYEENEDIPIALLHCVLNYPTDASQSHLGMIKTISKIFPRVITGYSDHVVPDDNMNLLTYAYLLGANIIEKHFTLDKKLAGNDHYHAMDVDDVRRLVKNVNEIKKIYASDETNLLHQDLARKNARRSLIAAKNISPGQEIRIDDLIVKRPGTGIAPKFIDEVIGRRATRSISKDEIINWIDVE